MAKLIAVIVILVFGLALGFWLALGPHAPAGVIQTWDQVKASYLQLKANADLRIQEFKTSGFQGARSGPGLLDTVTAPFSAFASGVQGFWLNLGKGIRPPH